MDGYREHSTHGVLGEQWTARGKKGPKCAHVRVCGIWSWLCLFDGIWLSVVLPPSQVLNAYMERYREKLIEDLIRRGRVFKDEQTDSSFTADGSVWLAGGSGKGGCDTFFFFGVWLRSNGFVYDTSEQRSSFALHSALSCVFACDSPALHFIVSEGSSHFSLL